LERFIESKFFNNPKEERLRKLFYKIRKAKPTGGKFSELNPQQLNTKPTDFSDLLKLVKDYIAYTEFQKDEQLQKRCLLKGLQVRKAKDSFKLLIDREIRTCQSNYTEDSPENYEHLMYLYELKFVNNIIEQNRHKKNAEILQELAYSVDRYYSLSKIQYVTSMYGMSELNAYEFDYGELSVFESILKQHSVETYPLLYARYAYLKFRQNPNKTMYEALKKIVLTANLILNEKKQFFERLINFIRKSMRHTNDTYWHKELLEIYGAYFEYGIAFAGLGSLHGKVLPQHYINYMHLLVNLNLLQQAEELEEKYAHKRLLTVQNRDFIHLYDDIIKTQCKDIKSLERMEKKLAVMSEPDFYYRITFEILAIKTCYNCHHRAFTNKREQFRDYIRHQKQLGKDFKQIYLNFATLSRRLHNFQQKKINDKPPTVERIWLMEKWKELEKGEEKITHLTTKTTPAQ